MSSPLPLNPALKNVPVYQGGRPIDEVAREMGLPASDIIKLASNENPLGPSPAALAAMQKVIAGLHLYPDGNAFYLKQRLAEKLDLRPENLILGNGSSEIIEFVGHALLGPGVDAVMSQYSFIIYMLVARLFGANPIVVPAKKYGHDLPAMLAAITPQTKVVFVANPNNPTGTVASQEEILQFVNTVPERVLVVMDEAYIEFQEEPADLLPLVREGRPNLIIMRTFSKIFGLAGLRIGYGVASPELISGLESIRQPFNINSLAQAGALAALEDAEHVRKTRANNAEGMRLVSQGLRELGVEYIPSAGNFILARVGDGKRVFDEMQKLGVIVRPMGGYDLPEWVRISIGTAKENARCLAALKQVL
ncbi:MAG TPA: histidinol-phosphate transaminase [Verrucomicrobiae bacterium]|jgi:histidinol-phosphate aminotransferase|nr:histidinol-phosphate transaminase [Verrucomicrobiae bacterium]